MNRIEEIEESNRRSNDYRVMKRKEGIHYIYTWDEISQDIDEVVVQPFDATNSGNPQIDTEPQIPIDSKIIGWTQRNGKIVLFDNKIVELDGNPNSIHWNYTDTIWPVIRNRDALESHPK